MIFTRQPLSGSSGKRRGIMAVSGSRRCAMTLHLRELTPEERSRLEKLACSRTAPAQTVERARILWQASQGDTAPSIAAELRLDGDTVRRRISRFNAEGLGALEDHPRRGRPATYSP